MSSFRADDAGNFAYLRAGLAARLVHAQQSLPPGLKLLIIEGYRPPEIAPHCAGAAIDLTLCTEDGRELDLGTSVNASPEQSAGACYADHPSVAGEGRRNRVTLAGALRTAGFVNYPTEWWHWSYGDQYWAMITGAPRGRLRACQP